MKRLGRFLLRALAVVVVLVVLVFAVRLVNGLRYPTPESLTGDLKDASRYSLSQPGMTVERLTGDYLNGFHLHPDAVTHRGLVVLWGGSDGGPDYSRAVRLAGQGYEVLSLFFFGQANQKPLLAEVPLDFFDEVLAWRAQHVPDGPLTVLGTSKGAELALALQARYPEIDNVVVYTPTEYVWQGLDFSRPASSWTFRGEPLPYVSTQRAAPSATAAMFAAMLLNYPMPLRELYATAAASDPNAAEARIPLELTGHLLAFAGDDDAMWPGDVAANALGAVDPPRTEAHVYPAAGHLFGDHEGWANGLALGGAPAANAAAGTDSDAILDAALAAWHA